MCNGRNKDNKLCSKLSTCYRFKAKPSMMQSWFISAPFRNEKCEYYWKEKDYAKSNVF